LVEQRHHADGECAVALVLLANARGDYVDVGLCLPERDAALQAGSEVVVLVPATLEEVSILRERDVDVDAVRRRDRLHHLVVQLEAALGHSGHDQRVAVQCDGLADDRGVAAIEAGPEPVAEDGDWRFAGLVVLGLQHTAELRPCAQHLEQVGGRSQNVDAVRLVEAGEVHGGALRDGDIIERLALRADVVELPGGRPVEHDADAGRPKPEHGEAVGVGERQRTQQQRVHYAEYGGVGADADGQGKHDYG
jgi:hypothetical protein